MQKLREQTDQLGQSLKALEYDKKAKNASRIGKAAVAIAAPTFGIGQITEKGNRSYLMDQIINAGNKAYHDYDTLNLLKIVNMASIVT